MNRKEKIIYAAGIIDGEGCINISRQKRSNGNYHCYELNVRVNNTSKELIDWLHYNFGGYLLKQRDNRKESYKDVYTWKIDRSRCLYFLNSIYPYLIIKKPEVDIATKFRNTFKSRKREYLNKVVPIREQCYHDMHEFKMGISKGKEL